MAVPIALAAKKLASSAIKKGLKKAAKNRAKKKKGLSPTTKGIAVLLMIVVGWQIFVIQSVINGAVVAMAGAAGGTESGGGGGGVCSPVAGKGSNNVAKAMDFFMGIGLTANQAAGLVGNMQVESGAGLNPKAKNSLGFTGIVQWDPTYRWPRENKFAEAIGKGKFTLNAQLRYAAWELGFTKEWPGHPSPYSNVGLAIKGTDSANEAAYVVYAKYEIPLDGGASLPKRQEYARKAAAKYGGGNGDIQPISGSSGSSTEAGKGCGGPTSGGSLAAFQRTVLKYAWPNWAPDGRLKQMPGYQKAVARAQKENRFVGKLPDEPAGRPVGDHCSAFISLLMHDSGWDPTYNFGGKLSKGAGFVPVQERWMKKHWKRVGAADDLSVSDLKPGDVGIANSSGLIHVWVYVGKIPGFHGQWAEASYLYGNNKGFAPEARKSATVLYANVPGATYYRRPATFGGSSEWVNPLGGHHTVSSPYGWRHNPGQGGANLFHYGVDLVVPNRSKIHAACSGIVVKQVRMPKWGGYETEMKCGDIYVWYMHQSKFIASPGDRVKAGTVIGLTGGVAGAPGSGDSTGPHLHFQIQKKEGQSQAALSSTVDPVLFMKSKNAPL